MATTPEAQESGTRGSVRRLGPLNEGYLVELYERFRQDPASVPPEARAFFAEWTPPTIVAEERAVAPAPAVAVVAGAVALAQAIRERGHRAAKLDPLGRPPAGDPSLDPAMHGISEQDLAALPPNIVGGPVAQAARTALDAMDQLRAIYSGTTGYEFEHIAVPEEREWLRSAVESGRLRAPLSADEKVSLLRWLTEVEAFEQFLHRTFVGQKRFSVEGNDVLIPMLDILIRASAQLGTRDVVIGMAHRGRLNVLAHVLGKPYEQIFAEFHDPARQATIAPTEVSDAGWTGDVKYHLGAQREYRPDQGDVLQVVVTLPPNPSHLEFVDPVVEGMVRAAQEHREQPGLPDQDLTAALAILVHGDAAFSGEGVVAETLNLAALPAYRTGGTIHIIVNNQLGFTTEPEQTRSTCYASDLGKGFEIPIVHVNADDPEACVRAVQLAHEYRTRFHKDFVIDLVGYRRWGHNESDEPAFTQPRMYHLIAEHATVRALFAQRLIAEGTVSADEVERLVQQAFADLEAAYRASLASAGSLGETEPPHQLQEPGEVPSGEATNRKPATSAEVTSAEVRTIGQRRDGSVRLTRQRSTPRAVCDLAAVAASIQTAVPRERLERLNQELNQWPADFNVHPKLLRTFERRREALGRPRGIDWAHAELLAFASLIADGTPVRLTGQDTERGTFSQRHLVLHDVETGETFIPIQHLNEARASFAVHNSPLSETAPMGFEYGYSVHAPDTLVLWEAQFGDFANVGQVVVDQFIASGHAKWGQPSGLVLLLPHGYEGQGPEHSSARMERFLQLAATCNLRVASCTTAAQYFHLLRQQAGLLSREPRPLVIFTPKSFLRLPAAASSADDLTEGSFRPVLGDTKGDHQAERVERLILCSGKVYYDLAERAQRLGADQSDRLAISRVELLYPFPVEELIAEIQRYPRLREVIWLQEEPMNMGAWSFVAPILRSLLGDQMMLRYAGRPEQASPAVGSATVHEHEQAALVDAALGVGKVEVDGVRYVA